MKTTSIQGWRNGKNNPPEPHGSAIFALNMDCDSATEKKIAEYELQAPVKAVTGCYNGVKERSYVVSLLNTSTERVIDLARKHGQKSVLFISNHRRAWLYFIELRDEQPIGFFTPVTANEAIASDAWTLDGNQFYICK